MKIVILGAEARYRAYQPAMPFIQQQELVFLDKDSTEAEILAAGADAEVLFVDAITVVSAALMEHMPCLRLFHSEGVRLTALTSPPPGSGAFTSATTRAATPGPWRSRRSC